MFTTNNEAFVVFRTNEDITDEGFLINYNMKLPPTTPAPPLPPGCKGDVLVLSGASGELRSPSYDLGKYPSDVKCSWRINVAADKAVEVNFERLSIEDSPSCVTDHVTLYDGTDREAPLLGTFCGSTNPSEHTSSGPTMFITFDSDNTKNVGGFSLTWTTVEPDDSTKKTPGCNGKTANLDQSSGVLASPHYGTDNYPNNASCSWRIAVPTGMNVLLKFDNFSLEPPFTGTTCFDAVTVYDGPDSTSDVIGTYCGDGGPGEILASTNQLYITFQSEQSNTAPGFLASWSTKKGTGTIDGHDCGVSSVLPTAGGRIVGGEEATPHSWPWLISVLYGKKGWSHWCGASILTPRWVITAAHCINTFGHEGDFKIVAGEHNVKEIEGTEKQITIKKIYMHEKYNPNTNDNDIALFELSEELHYDRNIKPICLPKDDVAENTLCVAAGWGDTRSTGNQAVLNQVMLPVLSRLKCNERAWYAGKLTENMMCAGYPEGRKDSCQGDSGGPLACLIDGRYRLFGLTSWGEDCAGKNRPGIYTRVTRYLDWIESHTGELP